VCWREAISSLHIPVGVRRYGGIASPDYHQARNDEIGLFARNDEKGKVACNDAPFPSLRGVKRRSNLLIAHSCCYKAFWSIASLTTFACNGVTKTLLIALQRSPFIFTKVVILIFIRTNYHIILH